MDFTKLLSQLSPAILPLLAAIAGLVEKPVYDNLIAFLRSKTESPYEKALRVGYAALVAARKEYTTYFDDPNVKYDDYILLTLKDLGFGGDPAVPLDKLVADLKAVL